MPKRLRAEKKSPSKASGLKGGEFSLKGARARVRLMDIFQRLLAHFGERHWWPGDSPFEVMVGAVLTQNTAWRNVVSAIANLKELDLMLPEKILSSEKEILAKALKPSGYYNVKAKRLSAMVKFIMDSGTGGENPSVLAWPMDKLRGALLEVNGLGPETADSILLYAAHHPSFVVDAYTRRILKRHMLIVGDPPYEEIRNWFMETLTPSRALYNEYHALLVACGHHFCSPVPACDSCPLDSLPKLEVILK
ncbi:MAG: endonuclease III domain-containing protein [Deltaproteobacteria bacterium]|jgi:endonuclease-3 related protein|nr:endonuclease III domain-containing protein [Deltaproteobacteria bacterium]